MPNYNRGDVLVDLTTPPMYTLVVHTPSQREDERYLVLNLLLERSDREGENGVFQLNSRAVREPQNTAINNGGWTLVDHVNLSADLNDVDLSRGRLSENSIERIFQNHPELERYLRVASR